MSEAWIVSIVRTPIGRAQKGALAGVRADDLAAHAIRAALARVPALRASEVEDLMLGCAQPAGEQGYNMARVVSMLAGLAGTPGTTVNRYCASSLQAVRMAAHAIRAGEGDVFVCAGVESVSRYDRGKADGMPDTKNPALTGIYTPMGETAELVADREGVTRAEMDAFAARSQARAVAAQAGGFFAREIVPVTRPDGVTVSVDDGPRPGTTVERLAELKPVFRPDGRVTAGNACPLNDGAAAAVVMSATRARALGVAPIARIVATAVTAVEPELMGLGPIEATRAALRRAKMTMGDVDLVEMNEAFAAQVIPSARALGIPGEKLNAHGGAIALGHPFGMTGVRLLTTLLNGLASKDRTIGLATLCVGGGQGMAMLVERL